MARRQDLRDPEPPVPWWLHWRPIEEREDTAGKVVMVVYEVRARRRAMQFESQESADLATLRQDLTRPTKKRRKPRAQKSHTSRKSRQATPPDDGKPPRARG